METAAGAAGSGMDRSDGAMAGATRARPAEKGTPGSATATVTGVASTATTISASTTGTTTAVRSTATETSAGATATTTATDVKPGNPNGAAPPGCAGKRTVAAVAAVKANADRRAIDMAGIVAAIRAKGA